MKLPRFRRASTPEALLETTILGEAAILALLALRDQLPANTITQGVLFVGGGCALWQALRLKLAAQRWWRMVVYEALNTAALGLAVCIGLPLLTIPLGRWEMLRATPGVAGMVPLLASVPTFALCRGGQYLWRCWNRLRKRRLIWMLMHAHMSVVMVVALLMALIGTVYVVATVAEERASEPASIAAVVERITLTVLPFLGVAGIMTALALAAVLPPAALISYLFSRRVTRRLEALAQSAGRFRLGDYDARVAVSGQDEVTQLQADFNAMADELKATLDALQAERDTVTDLLMSRRQLTAAVSHELRTPLATIQGYLESALAHPKPELPGGLEHDLRIMRHELDRLERLVTDLLTLSQTELHQLPLRIQPADLGAVARRVAETHRSLAWARGRVEVFAQVECDPTTALVDEGRLEQVLANLLRNAVRHTPPGGIVALVVTDLEGWIQLEVRDTGEGILPEELQHIWDRFRRGSHAEDGAGLGLAVVKELTEAMGGTAGVETAPGRGSTFTVRFPKP